MGAAERRELVLQAATRTFARGGFAATSTDTVAREAGVSQPYVVRIFGTKLDLFLEVFERSTHRVRAAFEEVLAAGPFDPDRDEDWERLGHAYADLLQDQDLLQVMMHGFSAGHVDEIAALSRRSMGDIYATIASTGCAPEQARDFIAHGMLLNVMLAMRAPEHAAEGGSLAPLTACTFDLAVPPGGPRALPDHPGRHD